jgi:beta-glucosidase-like glycosyl hydrolase
MVLNGCNDPKTDEPFRDPALSFDQRVDDLVDRMTLDEKISQMVYDAPAIERLGIPAYNWWNECLHGVARAGIATVFPQAIGLGAMWDDDFMLKIAETISDEARAKHHEFVRRGSRKIYQGLTFLSPNINIFRDPRWGRGMETYGEDPFLMGKMGTAFVKGLQGDHSKYLKVVDTPEAAVALAVKAGTDLNCGDAFPFLKQAVEMELVSESEIDVAVKRLFKARFKLGMFDPPESVPWAQIPYLVNSCAKHDQLSHEAARKSIVLLKNENQILPLRKDNKKVVVIGPNADDVDVLLGNYNGTPSRPVTPLEAIRKKVSDQTLIESRNIQLYVGGKQPGLNGSSDAESTQPLRQKVIIQGSKHL